LSFERRREGRKRRRWGGMSAFPPSLAPSHICFWRGRREEEEEGEDNGRSKRKKARVVKRRRWRERCSDEEK